MPGGIAEVFTSSPRKQIIVFKFRRGLIKLALETGASIVPCYVFGATDFFNSLADPDGLLSKISRKLKLGITFFWGVLGLPIPYTPKVTMCLAEPLRVEKWSKEGPIPNEVIQELHDRYIDALCATFDNYKASAGYEDAKLIIT